MLFRLYNMLGSLFHFPIVFHVLWLVEKKNFAFFLSSIKHLSSFITCDFWNWNSKFNSYRDR